MLSQAISLWVVRAAGHLLKLIVLGEAGELLRAILQPLSLITIVRSPCLVNVHFRLWMMLADVVQVGD